MCSNNIIFSTITKYCQLNSPEIDKFRANVHKIGAIFVKISGESHKNVQNKKTLAKANGMMYNVLKSSGAVRRKIKIQHVRKLT